MVGPIPEKLLHGSRRKEYQDVKQCKGRKPERPYVTNHFESRIENVVSKLNLNTNQNLNTKQRPCKSLVRSIEEKLSTSPSEMLLYGGSPKG